MYYLKDEDIGKRRLFETAIHKVRDGLALAHLAPTICEFNYGFGRAFLNIPDYRQADLRARGRLKVAEWQPKASDMIVLSTRPALDDRTGHGTKKRGTRRLDVSPHDMETAILGSVLPFFKECSRSRVTLSDNVQLGSDDERFRDITYRVQGTEDKNTAGAVKQFIVNGSKLNAGVDNLTVGYILGLPRMVTGGPRLLVTFGMGGTETLWLTFLLATALSDELRAAISTRRPRLRLIPFLVPRYAPFPLFDADVAELQPRVIVTKVGGSTAG